MRCLIALLSLALFSSGSFSQDQAMVDSLLVAYNNSVDNSKKVSTLKLLFWQYYYTDPGVATKYAAEMRQISEAQGFIPGQWTAYNLLGILKYSKSEFDSACFYFKQGVDLSDDDQYYDQRIYSLNYAGHSYRLKSEYAKADSCFTLFLKVVEKKDDNYNLARAYKALAINNYTQDNYSSAIKQFLIADSLFNDTLHYETAEVLQNIGIIYKSLDDYGLAKKYYDEALFIYSSINDSYGIYAIERSLGSIELATGNYEKARDHLVKAYGYYENFNDSEMVGTIARMLGQAYLNLNDNYLAEGYYRKSIEKFKGAVSSQSSYAFRGLGDALKRRGNISDALSYYDSAMLHAKRSSSPDAIMEASESLAEGYLMLQDFEKAYNWQEVYHHLSDSLNMVKSSKELYEVEAKYQNDKKEREIQLLTAQNKLTKQEKQSQLYLLASLVVLVLILAGVFYFLYRNRQKVANKLQELDSMKSNFFANISHEFRTPITLIKGPIEDLLSKTDLDDTNKENLAMAERNTERLLSLVDQLLDLSKLEAKSMTLKVSEASAFSELRVIADSFKYLIDQKQIDYLARIPEEDDKSWFDKNALEKIAYNLLSNAVKYTEEKGSIKCTAKISSHQLVLIVSNTGKGLSESERSKILDRFYQIDASQEGVGIGLALVKELTSLHKGILKIKSEENGWTDFIVVLPVDKRDFDAEEIHEKVEEEVLPKPGLSYTDIKRDGVITTDVVSDKYNDDKPILLVVEDSRDLRKMIQGYFEESFTILEAENGEQGINVAIDRIPDIIVSDVMMPVKDGTELAKTLKTDERTSHIPIVFLTAKSGDENVISGLETGADDYVIKPFNKDVLKTKVQNLIELRAKLRQRYSQEVILRPKDIAISSMDEKFLERVQKVLDTQLMESSFNSEAFSKEMGMSRMQLHRKLKALVGLTTTEFIKSQRLKMASHLLESSDINVSEVGYTVGFNDPSYFAKCFKEAYGCTPTEYATTAKSVN